MADHKQERSDSVKNFAGVARYWEPRRLVYNFFLTAVVVAWLVGTWPHFRPAMTLLAAFQFALLALLANLLYCAAYLGEVILQLGIPNSGWFLSRRVMWVVGTVFAILLENYWIADEIYPYVS